MTILRPDGLDPLADPSPSWLRSQVNLGNIVLAAGVLLGVGGYVKGYEALEKKAAVQEQRLDVLQSMLDQRFRDEQHANASTYSRRDVLEALLISINSRLTNIEGDVREMKRRGQ